MEQNKNKFWLGKHRSEETKKKISETLKKIGHKPPANSFRGYRHAEATKKKISKTKKGSIPWNKGKEMSDSCKEKISKAKLGNKNNLGKHWKRSTPVTKEQREKYALSKLGIKNPQWQGGISKEPYNIDWTETLRRAIRERDKYICRVCNSYGKHVHHIDYNKKNCNPDNLITLCNGCNIKANTNREYWTNYFDNLISE